MRENIIREYMAISRRAQSLEYDMENGHTSALDDFLVAAKEANDFYYQHNITKQELTEYDRRRRRATSVNSVAEGLEILKQWAAERDARNAAKQ